MLKKSMGLAAFLMTVGTATLAQAAVTNCTENIGGKKIEVTSTLDAGVYTVGVKADDQSLALLGGGCFTSSRPGTRYVLCTFDLGNGERLEIYPWVQTVSGDEKLMQFVLWNGDLPSSGAFSSCSNK